MTRRELREQTFCALFQKEFYLPEEIGQQVLLFLSRIQQEQASPQNKEEIKAKVLNIMAQIPDLDKKIEDASEGWKASRMGKVELTIMRLALYEILFDEQVPTGVAINEAVELAKKYGGDDAPSFVNGILAKLV